MPPIKHIHNPLGDFGQLQCFPWVHPNDLERKKKMTKYHKITPLTNTKPCRFTERCCSDTEAAFLLGSPRASWEKRRKNNRFNMKKTKKKKGRSGIIWVGKDLKDHLVSSSCLESGMTRMPTHTQEVTGSFSPSGIKCSSVKPQHSFVIHAELHPY